MTDPSSAVGVGSAELQWEQFIASLPIGDPVVQGLYNGPLALLADAIRAYHAGAIGAAVISCRAAIESACYVVLTTIRHKPGSYSYVPPRDLSNDLRQVDFKESLKAVRDRGLLPDDLVKYESSSRYAGTSSHISRRVSSKKCCGSPSCRPRRAGTGCGSGSRRTRLPPTSNARRASSGRWPNRPTTNRPSQGLGRKSSSSLLVLVAVDLPFPGVF